MRKATGSTSTAWRRIVLFAGVAIVLVIVSLAGTLWWLWPSLAGRSPGQLQARCADNLRKISTAILLYAHNDRKLAFPPDLATLTKVQGLDPSVFLDPTDTKMPGTDAGSISNGSPHCSYIYPWQPGWSATTRPSVVVLYEPLALHDGLGVNVLYADGRIEWLDAVRAEKVIRQIEAGINPP